MKNRNLLMAWYASTRVGRGTFREKDKAVLKWVGIVLGVVLAMNLVFLILMY